MGRWTRWLWSIAVLLLAGCATPSLQWDPTWAAGDPSPPKPSKPASRDPKPQLPTSRAWTGERETPDGMWSHTDPGEVPSVRGPDGYPLPLQHTDVHANLLGPFAEVTVAQTYRNRAVVPTEVVYRFPLPENAAVSRMRMIVDGRVIESRVMERDAARNRYEDAKTTGHTAALLEQERPNLFVQSLANLPPGEILRVELTYAQTLTHDAGLYEFVFPMVLGQRYSDGEVADAARVNPPVVGKGERRGDLFDIHVVARTGQAIDRWWAPTHAVHAEVEQDTLRVALRQADRRPNRDFVLRYGAPASSPHANLYLGPRDTEGRGHFALVVYPPTLDLDTLVGRREFIFVVDRSGSMRGTPLALAKETLRGALQHLRPVDTFDVVAFDSSTARLFSNPRPANRANLTRALHFVDGMRAGGGTEMRNAAEAALVDDTAPGRHRYVVFLTDGFISYEDELITASGDLVSALAAKGQEARVFAVGIGDSPNDFLLQGLSEAGRGLDLRVSTPTEAHDAVAHLARWIDHPVIDHLQLQTPALSLSRHHPHDLGGLFASHAAVVHGQYRGDASKAVPRLRGAAGRSDIEIPVRVVDVPHRGRLLGALWAEAAIRDLEFAWWASSDAEAKAEITRLGLAHELVTAFTSLVAVDTTRVTGPAGPVSVEIPAQYRTASNVSVSSSYVIDGADVVSPHFGLGSTLKRHRPGKPTEWAPRARVVFGRPAAPSSVSGAAIRKRARAVRPRLRACYETSPKFESSTWFDFPVVLHWERDGVKVQLRNRKLPSVRACMRRVLERLDWPAYPEGTTVTLPLRLSTG